MNLKEIDTIDKFINNIPTNISGIYCIKNTKNNKRYIGQSICLRRRLREHINELRNNKHHNILLQNSFNKNKESIFIFYIVEITENNKNILNTKEEYWIRYFNSDCSNCGYNLNSGGDSRLATKTVKEKISKDSKHKWDDKNFREKMLIIFHSKECIQKRNLGVSIRNKNVEYRKKLSDSKKGNKNPMYGKTGCRNHRYGQKMPKESVELNQKHRLETWYKKYPQELADKIQKLLLENKSVKTIVKEVGYTRTIISTIIEKYNLIHKNKQRKFVNKKGNDKICYQFKKNL